MKKTFTFLFIASTIFLLASNTSFAQFRLKLGPNLGLNYNIGTGSDVDETMTGIGMVIGGTVDMAFTPTIGLITNMQFYDNRSGGTSTEGSVQGIAYTVNDDRSIAYFMIEPLFKLTIPSSSFYFVAGPAVGFAVQGSYDVRITSQNNQVTFQDGSTKATGSIKDMLVRFALKFGSGYDIKLGSIFLTPQLAFEYGLTNIVSDVKARILTIQLTTAVKFSII
ncbi:MAG: outer membrane beta-barrel protein [Ignavibacteriaceae bacterium]|nr:outer membrane beta-barrel protein [Ignavibacteriaceae bacterium]